MRRSLKGDETRLSKTIISLGRTVDCNSQCQDFNPKNQNMVALFFSHTVVTQEAVRAF